MIYLVVLIKSEHMSTIVNNSFSVIIPAYKEEKFIENTLTRFLAACRNSKFEFEIIVVVDKAPNDKTDEIVKSISKSFREIVVVSREGKLGICSAIKEGIKKASKNAIIITVAGKHVDPYDIIKMMYRMKEGYDMVFGDRFSRGLKLPGYQLTKLIANRLCNFVISILFGIKARDITSGVKAYKADILKKMKIDSIGFEIFVEMPIKAYINGNTNFSVVELVHSGRDPETSHFNLVSEWPKYLKMVMKCFLYKLNFNQSVSLNTLNGEIKE